MGLERILENLRIDHDYTQEDFGKLIHVEQPTVSNYESGKSLPSLSVLTEIADLYDVSIDYLLERTPVKMSFNTFSKGIETDSGSKISFDSVLKLDNNDKERLIDYIHLLSEQSKYHVVKKSSKRLK